MELKDTVELMNSSDYKLRFIAEYLQTKIRYEKLKVFNTKIEASGMCGEQVKEPKHDCPEYLLKRQQATMGEYLNILELRAVIEGIDLSSVKSKLEILGERYLYNYVIIPTEIKVTEIGEELVFTPYDEWVNSSMCVFSTLYDEFSKDEIKFLLKDKLQDEYQKRSREAVELYHASKKTDDKESK